MRIGGKCVKDVSGYDLISCLLAQGTLGVVTRIWLKLCPCQVQNSSARPSSACRMPWVVPKIMTGSGVVAHISEFMDSLSIEAAAMYLNATPHGVPAYVIIEIEANTQAQVEAEYETVGKLLMDNGALEVYVADNLSTSQRIWAARKCIAEALRLVSPVYCMEDITVPTSEIPGLVAEIKAIGERHNVTVPCFGHAGDGNIHATLLKKDMDDATWESCKAQVLGEIYEATYTRGGNLSGEHGIGAKRIDYFERLYDPVALDVTRRIKAALDPNLILNPGKVVRPA